MLNPRRGPDARRQVALAGWVLFLVVCAGGVSRARAAPLTWKGHTWNVTSGGMAGVCQGNPANVTVDADGFLHLKISNNGGTWTAAELFTTDKIGFGTYQWQIDGPIDKVDKQVVVGLFPYGPAAGIGGDGTNEIDIEYSRWGIANAPNADWTDYPSSGKTIGELTYTFSLGGSTLSTSRFVWNKTSITSSLLSGLQPVGGTTGLIKSWEYAPANPTTNIPQQALPLGMNLWCFNSPPSDGKPVEIVIRDFTFVAEGSSSGAAGSGGAAGQGGAAGHDGGADAGGSGGPSGAAGASGGAGAAGGSGGTSGAAGVGGSAGTSGAAGVSGGAGTSGVAGATGDAGSGLAGVGGEAGAAGTSGGAGVTGSAGQAGRAGGGEQAVHSSGCSIPGGDAAGLGGTLLLLACAAEAARRRRAQVKAASTRSDRR